jgi:hypothetical protein
MTSEGLSRYAYCMVVDWVSLRSDGRNRSSHSCGSNADRWIGIGQLVTVHGRDVLFRFSLGLFVSRFHRSRPASLSPSLYNT